VTDCNRGLSPGDWVRRRRESLGMRLVCGMDHLDDVMHYQQFFVIILFSYINKKPLQVHRSIYYTKLITCAKFKKNPSHSLTEISDPKLANFHNEMYARGLKHLPPAYISLWKLASLGPIFPYV